MANFKAWKIYMLFLIDRLMNPAEWRWDDEFYGHDRRYTRLFPKPVLDGSMPEERTRISTQQSAWEYSRLSTWIDRFFELTRLYLIR